MRKNSPNIFRFNKGNKNNHFVFLTFSFPVLLKHCIAMFYPPPPQLDYSILTQKINLMETLNFTGYGQELLEPG